MKTFGYDLSVCSNKENDGMGRVGVGGSLVPISICKEQTLVLLDTPTTLTTNMVFMLYFPSLQLLQLLLQMSLLRLKGSKLLLLFVKRKKYIVYWWPPSPPSALNTCSRINHLVLQCYFTDMRNLSFWGSSICYWNLASFLPFSLSECSNTGPTFCGPSRDLGYNNICRSLWICCIENLFGRC